MTERRRYVVVGCPQRALVWYAVVRAALKALQLQHVVNVATADNLEWFSQLIKITAASLPPSNNRKQGRG